MNQRLYPILPLRDVVVYPHIIVPLFVGRSKSIAALDAAMAEDQELLLVPQRDAQTSEPSLSDLHTIGTFGRIVQMAKLSDGTVKVLVEGISRIRISEQTDSDTFKGAKALMPETDSLTEGERKSLVSLAVEQFGDYLKAHDRNPEELLEPLRQLGNPGQIADTIAAHMELDMKDRVHLLGLIDFAERIHQVLVLLAKAQEQFELDRNIKKRVKQQMERNQREYYLNEKIKAIQKELLELDEAQNEIDILENRIEKARMPQAAEKKACGELNKLKQMPSLSAEANVIRNYLEWMIDFPWSKRRRNQYNLERAEAILDRDHYGLKDVKERILEYLAVQKRNRGSKGPIICLVGPPGVGKTSLGKSIASATGRDFDRISLGGMHDEAEIRGHRRTYIGALPGKIVQKLCKLGSNNPLILLDEIDKIGNDHRGDPASALLEVLDPAQNNSFNDHYLETDIDLSKVLFIATANTLNIAGPLLDRMEVIRLPGYTVQEKIQIAKRYIVPRQRKENALKTEEFHLGEGVINTVIEDYTREAGVRNLEREIGKLARKSVRKLLDKNTQSILVDNSNLDDFLGVAKFHRSEEDRAPKIGSVTGLAWTSVGGELLQIESTAFPGKGQLTRTGQLGDVMRESIQAAMSVVRGYLDEHDEDFRFSDYDIHMHLPEGATPKDGPSAGIGMATALLSALSKQPVYGTLAMTGEITLRGRVLAIGGLKEKLLAALRGHLKTVLIPAENVKDLRDMPEEILAALEIVPVSHIDEVFARAFCDQNMPFKVRIPARPTHFTGTPMSNPTLGHC